MNMCKCHAEIKEKFESCTYFLKVLKGFFNLNFNYKHFFLIWTIDM